MSITKKIYQLLFLILCGSFLFAFYPSTAHAAESGLLQDDTSGFTNEELQQMYSLDDFAAKFSKNNQSTVELPKETVEVPVKGTRSIKTAQFYDTAGTPIGACQLIYQTAIIGGRPQFVYDTCYLGNITHYAGWTCTNAYFTFTGDKITVYAQFAYLAFGTNATAVFYPN